MFQLCLTAENPDSDLLKTAVFLDSLCGVLKWIFLIIIVLSLNNLSQSIIKKKKNANPPKSKHSSKNTNSKER